MGCGLVDLVVSSLSKKIVTQFGVFGLRSSESPRSPLQVLPLPTVYTAYNKLLFQLAAPYYIRFLLSPVVILSRPHLVIPFFFWTKI